MNKIAKIGEKAPLLQLSDWLQGSSKNLDQLLGKVVLIEVFQVNCPGCFIYSLPSAVDLYQRYSNKGLCVIGMATAFEDFDKNTLGNLKLLVQENRVIGETLRLLDHEQLLINGRLAYSLPFPVAMDIISTQQKAVTDAEISAVIDQQVAGFKDKSSQEQKTIHDQAYSYLQGRLNRAETFNCYNLQGTPSHIVIDKQGILRACKFGHFPSLEKTIVSLLDQT